MKRIMFFALLLVAIGVVPALAAGNPGMTGLFYIPTADVPAKGITGASVQVAPNRISAGMSHTPMENVEFGVSSRSGGGAHAQFAAFIKGQLLPETSRDPGLAIGLDESSLFLVASKVVAPMFRAHVGYGTERYGGLFGGISYLVNPVVVSEPGSIEMPRITLIAEYDGWRPNAGARFSFAQGIDLDAALLNMSDLMIGVSWNTQF